MSLLTFLLPRLASRFVKVRVPALGCLLGHARAANALRSFSAEVLTGKRMALLAMSLAGVLGDNVVTAKRILSHSDKFQVFGIDAGVDAAAVVDDQPISNLAPEREVGETWSAACLAVSPPELAIAVFVEGGLPNPTAIVIDDDLTQEAFNGVHTVS